MKCNQYINALKSRHQKLDDSIQSETNQVNPDYQLIRQLKQKKLQLKDSMRLLERASALNPIQPKKMPTLKV